MIIRDALASNMLELQRIQALCPMGTQLKITVVNEPNFSSRANMYDASKIFVALDDNNAIMGTVMSSLKEAMVNGVPTKIGLISQIFTDPQKRRSRVAETLITRNEDYCKEMGAHLIYALTLDDNIPIQRLMERLGYSFYHRLNIPYIGVYKEMKSEDEGLTIRPMTNGDVDNVVALFNSTWKDYELYEPMTRDRLLGYMTKIPGLSYDNFIVLEKGGEILACLAYFDWDKIATIRVTSMNTQAALLMTMLKLLRPFMKLPSPMKAGDRLKQWNIMFFAYKEVKHASILIRHLNNLALQKGIQQLCISCDCTDSLKEPKKGFVNFNAKIKVYVKGLDNMRLDPDKPVWVNGIDL
jgi:N-acetylglutamate synthase-like GNAT family acetyltransferase